MQAILGIVLGALFGFVLHRVGAANPQNIINMLRLRDLHLMKVILLGIGTSSLLLFLLTTVGVIDVGNLSVKATHVGVLIGGAIFGAGFAIAGYCPGTAVCAAGSGRTDAWFTIGGGLVGALLFMLLYGALVDTFWLQSFAGGKTTVATTGSEDYGAILTVLPGWIVAGAIAVAFIAVAVLVPRHPLDRSTAVTAATRDKDSGMTPAAAH